MTDIIRAKAEILRNLDLTEVESDSRDLQSGVSGVLEMVAPTSTSPTSLHLDPLFWSPFLVGIAPERVPGLARRLLDLSMPQEEGISVAEAKDYVSVAPIIWRIVVLRHQIVLSFLDHIKRHLVNPEDVHSLVSSLVYPGLAEDVQAQEWFAVAFAAALAEVSDRLGLIAVRQWARELFSPFVPGFIMLLHRSAGDERAGAALMSELRSSMGDEIGGFGYQLIWRTKKATSVVSKILKLWAAETAKGGSSRDDQAGAPLSVLANAGGSSYQQYQDVVCDHFACTAILKGLAEPIDYAPLAEQIGLGNDWKVIKTETIPRFIYHRRLSMVLEHRQSAQRLEMLVKSSAAFSVGRAYQWTAKGTSVLAHLGPFRDGAFDWPEAARRIEKAGSITRALAAECLDLSL